MTRTTTTEWLQRLGVNATRSETCKRPKGKDKTMARIRKNANENADTTETTETVNENAITGSPVSDMVAESFDSVSDSDDENELMPWETLSADTSTNDTEGVNDMTATQDTTVTETTEATEAPVTDETPVTEEENAIIAAATAKLEAENAKSIELLDVNKLPATAMVIKLQLQGLTAMTDMLSNEVKAFVFATSGKDEKISAEIENLTESSDPDGYALRESIATAKETIAKLTSEIEANEKTLYTSVEARLAEAGESLLSEEQAAEKTTYINDLYGGYREMYKGVEKLINSHRAHRADDGVGTIEQYVTMLPKPFAKAGAKSGSTGGGTRRVFGPKAPSVTSTDYSLDGGVTWNHIAKNSAANEGVVYSNPTYLASELSKLSSMSNLDIKAAILDAWYADNNMTSDDFNADGMKVVSEFTYSLPLKEEGKYQDVLIKLTRPVAANVA